MEIFNENYEGTIEEFKDFLKNKILESMIEFKTLIRVEKMTEMIDQPIEFHPKVTQVGIGYDYKNDSYNIKSITNEKQMVPFDVDKVNLDNLIKIAIESFNEQLETGIFEHNQDNKSKIEKTISFINEFEAKLKLEIIAVIEQNEKKLVELEKQTKQDRKISGPECPGE